MGYTELLTWLLATDGNSLAFRGYPCITGVPTRLQHFKVSTLSKHLGPIKCYPAVLLPESSACFVNLISDNLPPHRGLLVHVPRLPHPPPPTTPPILTIPHRIAAELPLPAKKLISNVFGLHWKKDDPSKFDRKRSFFKNKFQL